MPTPSIDGPLISVVMGVRYRRENLFLLERAVSSILGQTYQNLEFLICENGSTEEARAQLERFAREDARVRLIDGGNATGFSEELNRCLKVAKSEYIARMDDDDFSHPDRLEKQMAFLREHRDVAFVGCVAQLERGGQLAGQRKLPEKPTVRDFYIVQPFLHPTLLFRREALKEVGGYSEETRCVGCEDYDLLLRLYETGLLGENIQEPLFTYTLPPLGSKKRTMALRWNEVKTRYVRFRALRLLPETLPYVIKPVLVGLLPERTLMKAKRKLGMEG